jgi:hypothetical protein
MRFWRGRLHLLRVVRDHPGKRVFGRVLLRLRLLRLLRLRNSVRPDLVDLVLEIVKGSVTRNGLLGLVGLRELCRAIARPNSTAETAHGRSHHPRLTAIDGLHRRESIFEATVRQVRRLSRGNHGRFHRYRILIPDGRPQENQPSESARQPRPQEIRRVNFEEMICPECGERFDAAQARVRKMPPDSSGEA